MPVHLADTEPGGYGGRPMTKKIKIHDGIIGALLTVSAALAFLVHPGFIWLTVATGAIMIQSAFTGFCPVHYLVNKAVPDDKP